MRTIDFVRGTTKTFMLFGSPVEHSFSPILQNTVAAAAGIESVYTAMHVTDLGSAVKGAYAMGVRGINITVPFKEEVIRYLCGVDERAKAIGAVNTLKFTGEGYYGCNTDIMGLSMSLKLRGIDIKGKTVVILGAGGAAKAAAAMALGEKCGRLYIINRTAAKAEELKSRMSRFYGGDIICGDYDSLKNIEGKIIMIQTTSVGMGKGVWKSPIEYTEIFEHTEALVDIVYNPLKTKIMAEAEKYGVKCANGLDMLIYQGIASFEIWNDIKISDETKLALRDSLTEYYERGI